MQSNRPNMERRQRVIIFLLFVFELWIDEKVTYSWFHTRALIQYKDVICYHMIVEKGWSYERLVSTMAISYTCKTTFHIESGPRLTTTQIFLSYFSETSRRGRWFTHPEGGGIPASGGQHDPDHVHVGRKQCSPRAALCTDDVLV